MSASEFSFPNRGPPCEALRCLVFCQIFLYHHPIKAWSPPNLTTPSKVTATNMATDEPTTGQACGKPVSELTLCYLVCTKDAAGAFLGAIMITDYRARPEHFAYVLPVKPSSMQKILYGSTLEEHLRIDVIGQKLWQQIPRKPDIVFVESAELLDVRRVADVPAAVLSKREASEPGSLSEFKFESTDADREVVHQILHLLESTVNKVNLTEPFGRIKEALKEANKPAGHA